MATIFLAFACESGNQQGRSANPVLESNSAIGSGGLIERNAEDDKFEQMEREANEKTLAKAFEFANAHKQSKFASDSFLVSIPSFPEIKVQVSVGHLFDNVHRHLLFIRSKHSEYYIQVYQEKGDSFEKILEEDGLNFTFQGDSIWDINGDKVPDFEIKWYPSSGCCLANISRVFLYQHQEGNFAPAIEFINPTFYPDKKCIKGITYGHSAYEAGLYTYNWNGFSVDTVEYIFPVTGDSMQSFFKTKNQHYWKDAHPVVIKQIPEGYQEINYFEWFTGDF